MDEYEKIMGGRYPGFITGKPVGVGGSLGRTEATGFGVGYCVREALKRMGKKPSDCTAALQGFGNVAQYTAKKLGEIGVTVIAVSCWDDTDKKPYSFIKKTGVDVDQLMGISDKFGTIDKAKAKELGYVIADANAWIEQEVEILVPAALENQVTEANAPKMKKSVKLVAEGANGPTTPEADKIIQERGIYLIPDFLCNAGGVTCSYFEQVQNNANFYWTKEEVLTRLDEKMTHAFHAVADLAQERKVYMRDAAYMIAIDRVATACRLRGWV